MAEAENEKFIDGVKQRHGFEEWKERFEAVGFVSQPNFLPDYDDLPGLKFLRRRPRSVGGGFVSFVDDFEITDKPDARISIHILETPSVDHAHDALLEFLATCMAPQLKFVEDHGLHLGHIGFVGHKNVVDWVVFARGSIYIKVQNTGVRLIDISTVAAFIDEQILIFKP